MCKCLLQQSADELVQESLAVCLRLGVSFAGHLWVRWLFVDLPKNRITREAVLLHRKFFGKCAAKFALFLGAELGLGVLCWNFNFVALRLKFGFFGLNLNVCIKPCRGRGLSVWNARSACRLDGHIPGNGFGETAPRTSLISKILFIIYNRKKPAGNTASSNGSKTCVHSQVQAVQAF